MAAVNITITGIATDKEGNTSPITIVGAASLTGLEVGGGPMPPLSIWPSPGHPAHPIAPGGPPPQIWPSPGRPEHPIWGPPGFNPPGPGMPPGIWGGAPIGGGEGGGGGLPGRPTFPIWGPPGMELPPGEGYPPVAGHPLPPGEQPPKPIGGWSAQIGWSAENGWFVVLVPGEGSEVPTPSR